MNNLLVWYLAHTQHLKKPVRSEPICHGSPFPSAFRGKGSGYARLDYGLSILHCESLAETGMLKLLAYKEDK